MGATTSYASSTSVSISGGPGTYTISVRVFDLASNSPTRSHTVSYIGSATLLSGLAAPATS
ncbi:MAG: hypothetical protein ACYC91_12810 [Solirubrobacteraceae bacterium]